MTGNWICSDCGYDGLTFTITRATVEVAVGVRCPICNAEMFRNDPLGEIERDAHEEASA